MDQPGGSQTLDGETAHGVFPVKEVLDSYEELEVLGKRLADLQVKDSVTGQGQLIQVILVLPAQETAFHTKLDRALILDPYQALVARDLREKPPGFVDDGLRIEIGSPQGPPRSQTANHLGFNALDRSTPQIPALPQNQLGGYGHSDIRDRILQRVPEAVDADQKSGAGVNVHSSFEAPQVFLCKTWIGLGEYVSRSERTIELIQGRRSKSAIEGAADRHRGIGPKEKPRPGIEAGLGTLVLPDIEASSHQDVQSRMDGLQVLGKNTAQILYFFLPVCLSPVCTHQNLSRRLPGERASEARRRNVLVGCLKLLGSIGKDSGKGAVELLELAVEPKPPGLALESNLRWPRLVGQLGGLFKMYSYCHSYRQNLLGQIFLSLLLRL